jgi:hypothetical protein
MMKTIVIAALVATAAAFVPATSRRTAFNLGAVAEAESFSALEKERFINNCFDCHGFFPDMRDDSELPEEVLAFRQQPKPAEELAEIKAKYAAITNESDRAYTMLLDLGLMEDYDKLGAYSDDFADDAP